MKGQVDQGEANMDKLWTNRIKSGVIYLDVCAELLEDLIDLILKPSTQHFISFIQNKHLDPFWS